MSAVPPKSDASLRGRIAAHSRWAAEPDRRLATQPARAAAMRKYEDQVDPERILSDVERRRRAESARRAHMLRLALASARVRRGT